MSIDQETQQLYDAKSIMASHGIAATYLPKEGPPRSITVVELESDTDHPDSDQGINTQSRLMLFVLRVPDDEDYGGIDTPQIGDGLSLDRDEDVYAWTGRRQRADRYSWQLEFIRQHNFQRGGNNLR